MTHTWIPDPDEGGLICANCDTYKGSRASLRPCRAVEPEPPTDTRRWLAEKLEWVTG